MRHLFLFISLFCYALGFAQSGPVRNERVFEFRGVKYVTAVPNDPPAAPAWTPGAGEPPLTAAAALSAAEPAFQKTFGPSGAFKLQSINLTRQGSGWMYQVIYLQTREAAMEELKKARVGTGMGSSLLPVIYYVTLDGAVHGPRLKN